MTTNIFQLIDFPGNYKPKGGLPYGPTAYVGLKMYQTLKCPCDNGGEVELNVVSPCCMSQIELVEAIDMAIGELEKIKMKGQKFFQMEEKKRKGLDKKT